MDLVRPLQMAYAAVVTSHIPAHTQCHSQFCFQVRTAVECSRLADTPLSGSHGRGVRGGGVGAGLVP